MDFKIVDFGYNEDFGGEWYLTLLKGRNFSFLQVEFDWSVYGSGLYLQMSCGYGRLLSFLFVLGKLGFSFDLCGHTWPKGRGDDDESE